jgi:hypothetical protein
MIYTITMATDLVEKINIHGKPYQFRDYRVVGYFLDAKVARNAIINNFGDVQEKRHVYAILEAVGEGVYPNTKSEHDEWFKWNSKENKFNPCEKPEDLKNTCNFAIG